MDDPVGQLVKLSDKTMSSLEKGVASLTKPWTMRREGAVTLELRRKERLMDEKTRQDIDDVRLGKKAINDKFEIVPLNFQTEKTLAFPSAEEWERSSDTAFGRLASFAVQEQTLQAIERAINLKQIGQQVASELYDVGEEEVSSEPIDRDWFTKWRTYAQDTSSEELQSLWAKLLVGENRKPKAYSLHTLELLSRLSKEDAEIIAKVFKYSFGDGLPKFDKFESVYEEEGISFNYFLHLEALDIINGVSSSGLTGLGFHIRKQGDLLSEFFRCRDLYLYISGKSDQVPVVACYSLSQAGKEILSLVSQDSATEVLDKIATYIFDQAIGYKGSINVQIVRLKHQVGDERMFDPLIDLYKDNKHVYPSTQSTPLEL